MGNIASLLEKNKSGFIFILKEARRFDKKLKICIMIHKFISKFWIFLIYKRC